MLRPKKKTNHKAIILILEDDREQMKLLVNFVQRALSGFNFQGESDEAQVQKLANIEIVHVGNIKALSEAVLKYDSAVMSILDCNTPDAKGGRAHDQFVKSNHVITGRHKAVDLVSTHLPNTPITIISSMGRFQRIVKNYYAEEHGLKIDFISKSDAPEIKADIRHKLKSYLS